ncbi:MAG TPA: hypothetical protein DD728_15370 [Hyphomonas atlantica]|uniref:Uncharacterized protein n=1 Tax=Hyphomonas atlantica TaxID=1280948 RepID=A0A356W988_9PROT|nr:hypothetical protein [Hyphomonas atlantica]
MKSVETRSGTGAFILCDVGHPQNHRGSKRVFQRTLTPIGASLDLVEFAPSMHFASAYPPLAADRLAAKSLRMLQIHHNSKCTRARDGILPSMTFERQQNVSHGG